MNGYTTHFASTALAAEGRLNRVVDEMERRLAANTKLDAVEEAFLEAAADGEIDPEEMKALESLLREAGLGDEANALASLQPGKGLKDAVDELVNKGLKGARRTLDAGEFEIRTAMQMQLNEVTQNWANATNTSRMEHQAQMNIISNMKA